MARSLPAKQRTRVRFSPGSPSLASKLWYNGGMKKQCLGECGLNKDLEEFSWKDKKNNRRQSKCKTCYRKHRTEWYRTHKKSEVKTVIKYIHKRRKEVKAWLDNLKSQKSCLNCGEKRIQVLQFHHLDPSKKDINISMASNRGWSIKRIEKEISKCIILCANCHLIEHDRLRGELV